MLCVTILSGGMDSSTLAYFMRARGYDEQLLVSFNYGQRHGKELVSACKIAQELRSQHSVVDISSVSTLLKGSSQTDSQVEVPDGHYAQETMKSTVVPNRNAIMLSIAYGVAVASNANVLAYGAHTGDHFIYPDCRPEFVEALNQALRLGNLGFGDPYLHIYSPFSKFTKSDIVHWGLVHNVPYHLTWTCYKGGEKSCGRCGTCVERLQAFAENDATDPLEYEDREYWKKAIEEFSSEKRS